MSILTALSKVVERSNFNQLSPYFGDIFLNFLSGFRKGYSCQTRLLRTIEDWKNYLDNGNIVGTIAIDLNKNVLECDVKKMLYWFKINSLEANPSKFQSMLLKNKNVNAEDFNTIVDNDTIYLTASMNVLGININDKLNLYSHVSNVCNKTVRQLYVLQRLKGSLDYASRLSIYKSFIMSNCNYCPVVWMFTSKSSLSKLKDIQRRALRFVLDDYTSDYHELLNKADVPGLKIMALEYLAIEVYKCVNDHNPKYLNDLFTIKKCKYDLRDDSLINRNKVKTTNHGLQSFKDYGAKLWNILSEAG